MNVLITGGAGFIGCRLARFHADRGDEVFILDNFFKTGQDDDHEMAALQAETNVSVVTVDLTKLLPALDAPTDFAIVYHLAAINGTRLFYEMPYTVCRTNLLVTLNLLDWLETRTVGHLLYTSTSEVYADGHKLGLIDIPTSEAVTVAFSQPTDTRFSYATSKFVGEFLCLHFGKTREMPVSVVRYHNIYGPRMGNKHVIPEFVARLKQGQDPFCIYGGDQTRAFCYIADAIDATFAVASTPACDGETIHIGNPAEEIAITDLASTMMELTDHTCKIKECGGRSASVARRCPDTSKLTSLTGFAAQVPLREGLRATIDWYWGKV